MLKLKICPRCKRGYVIFDRDQYGWYEYCIQCSYLCDVKSIAELGQQGAFHKKRERRIRALSKGN
jgi:hypothetical protein